MSAANVIAEVLRRHPRDRSRLIMLMQDLQAELNYLPPAAVDAISEWLEVPRSQVYSAAMFYKAFSLEPRGKHQVDVCLGTACHVRGAGRLVTQFAEELSVAPGQTTSDREFTLNTVHCVGACALGPVVVLDGKYHGGMTPVKLRKALDRCREGAEGCDGRGPGHETTAVVAPSGATLERLASPAELEQLRARLRDERRTQQTVVSICAGSGCRALGAAELIAAFEEAVGVAGLQEQVRIQQNGCHGFCERGLICVIRPQGIFYQRVRPRDVPAIVERTLQGGEVIERLLYEDPRTGQKIVHEQDIPFYRRQHRLLMSQNALIDPLDIRDAIAAGGYAALAKALGEMEPDAVIDEVRRAGLRGRGGGGFHAARKWAAARKAPGDLKYILCNGDEGDPGAFMDCSLLEGNPHAVIEGMIIGAWAVAGRDAQPRGYVYVRNEYPVAVAHLQVALGQARAAGLLGENILGSGFDYDIEISRGGGSFVCGESTALMASIEGKIGEPRAKYVHTASSGLWGKPTVLNNVESWANVPLIVRDGSERWASVGTEGSKGTKIFSLVGKVQNTGLVEVPMGMTLREIVEEVGGGIRDGKAFKAVQTGGPSGGCVPASLLDLPVDFDALTRVGSMMGSGGMIVMDEDTCMVDVARYFTEFLAEESCGKCAACRNGLFQLLGILERICAGEGKPEDIPAMERLFEVLDDGSLCGLGKSAANPVRSTLQYFRAEYEAHILDRRCPAGVCRSLITYRITEECTGCTLCLDICPHGAITGKKKELHVIDTTLCNRCGLCLATCTFDAIVTS
jgi:NADH:ubiquinone oxidoreductase subunit F (NADH-binding)/NADH:ubiquinone oxidoreductase subunit E/Pyruvate/2-oxoacid:ferredoxin oxidoreductase delta subunit